MTIALTNVSNIMEQYEEKKEKNDKELTKIEILLTVYRIKQIIKSDFAQSIVNKYIIKDKTINGGRYTIKGTRITPEDIGRLVEYENNVTVEKILEEYPSLSNEEQILAGLFVHMKKIFTWRNILFS